MYEKLAYIGFASYYLGSIGVECGGGGGECYDINGRTISPGFHFVPGPDTCTLCVCDNGNPKWCKAVLCSPPQDCKSFRVGNSCCEFICLDDTFGAGGKGGVAEHDLASEFGLRLIAGAITAILCLSIVFFSIHRLRQRKIRGREPQLHHHHSHLAQVSRHHHGVAVVDPHDLAAVAAGGLRFADDEDADAYLSDMRRGGGPPHYTLWKPAAYAVSGLPRGQEAPPPYEEAVAAAQVEAALAAAAAAANANASSGPGLLLYHQHTTTGHHHSASHHVSDHRTIPLTLATSDCLFAHAPASQPPPPPQSGATSEPPRATVAPPHHRAAVAPQPHRVDLAPVAPPHRGGTMVDPAPVAPPHRGTMVDLAPVAPPHRGGTMVDLAPVAPPHRGTMVDLAPVAPPHRGTVVDSAPVAPPHRGTVVDSKAVPLALPPPPRVARHSVATSTSSCSAVAPQRRTSSNCNAPPTASVTSQVTPPPLPILPPPGSDVITNTKPPNDVTKPQQPPLLPTAAPQNNSRRTADSVGNPATRAHAQCASSNSSVPTRLASIGVLHSHHTMAMTSIAEEGQDVEGGEEGEEEEDEEEEDDDEDYRSECENCNLSVSGGMNDADCFVDDLETMTLHRKPPQADHCHLAMHQRRLGGLQAGGVSAQGGIGEWTSLTLPTNTRTQRPISVLCNSSQTSARENWFSSMPQTSSESSEEEEEE